ncbi:MAG: UDP-N-acetylmuramoyl-L-alanine--D-glutamate ligase [Leptospiraceae bacterium]|nr:UDP-N-acetylmuramoyl-L-alanine--D-glutamate ligase [Leptospiraceae bacterium]NUM42450.1 UDP-N-acetylmuramoyl-L-alanine--D-glutamate ligase [Leptospiraceae bacterium]
MFGGGSSGISAANLLKKYGKKIYLIDKKKIEGDPFDGYLSDEINFMEFEESIIVKSPGIHPSHKILIAARENNVPVFSEIDIGCIFFTGKIIGVTGTDGKSTTTSLVWHLIKEDFPNSKAGGNLGVPFTVFCEEKLDFAVLELSSYQLEDSMPIDFVACTILNLAPDHLERHGTMDNYLQAKLKILDFDNPKKIYITSDEFRKKIPIKNYNFVQKSFGEELLTDALILEQENSIRTKKFTYSTKNFVLKGRHNLSNLACAILLAESIGSHPTNIQKQIKTFQGLTHRFEYVKKIGKLEIINDSKSTNLHSMLAGLKGFDKKTPFILILGGIPKKEELSPMLEVLQTKNVVVFLYGEAVSSWEKPLRDILGVNLIVKENLKEVVDNSFEISEKMNSKYLLFSPACASFDQYKNFEERGNHFKDLVNRRIDLS